MTAKRAARQVGKVRDYTGEITPERVTKILVNNPPLSWLRENADTTRTPTYEELRAHLARLPNAEAVQKRVSRGGEKEQSLESYLASFPKVLQGLLLRRIDKIKMASGLAPSMDSELVEYERGAEVRDQTIRALQKLQLLEAIPKWRKNRFEDSARAVSKVATERLYAADDIAAARPLAFGGDNCPSAFRKLMEAHEIAGVAQEYFNLSRGRYVDTMHGLKNTDEALGDGGVSPAAAAIAYRLNASDDFFASRCAIDAYASDPTDEEYAPKLKPAREPLLFEHGGVLRELMATSRSGGGGLESSAHGAGNDPSLFAESEW